MCYQKAVKALPEPAPAGIFNDLVSGFAWGDATADNRIAVLPDIYGCNPFYRGLSTRYAQMGARVFLIDTFAGLGDLAEVTREAAFARRDKVRDGEFLDQFQSFVASQGITGVIGFCLGGLYVFELARRGIDAELVGLYGFPQGLPNQDALATPFDYLSSVTKRHTMLLGREDDVVGLENIVRLEEVAANNAAIDLKIYENVGHNFLPELDSDDPAKRAVAEDALQRCDAALI